ncbi:MAG: phosphoribosylanthranilate isomerase [Pseudomonadota bacterium]
MTSWPWAGRFVQVAGIHDRAEADLVIAAGATHLGFPLRLPDGREDLSEAEATQVIAHVGDRAGCLLITYLIEAASTLAFARTLGVGGVQLHGPMPADELAALRAAAPDLLLLKSLVVGEEDEARLLAFAREVSPSVDAFITDTFDPDTGRRGATGRTHDWSASRRLVHGLARPVILAGGLRPENVAAAVQAVRPAGIDAHTGVEDAAGRKSLARTTAFVRHGLEALAAV